MKTIQKYEEIGIQISSFFARPTVVLLCTIVFKVLFDIIYCNNIVLCFEGYNLVFSPINYFAGWIAVLACAYTMSVIYTQNKESSIMIIAFNMIYFIPITTFCGLGGGSSEFFFYAILYWLILSFLQIKIPFFELDNNVTITPRSKKIAIFIIVVFVSIISLYLWIKFAHCRMLLSLMDVYDVRKEASAYKIPNAIRIVWNSISVIVGVLITYFLKDRKYFLVLWLLFVMYIDFSYAGNKTIAFLPMLLLVGYIFYRDMMISLILPSGIALQIVGIVEVCFGKVYVTSFFLRRQGILLAQLSDYYFRFFRNHTTDLFRQGVVGKFGFRSIYTNIPNVIGNNYFTQNNNANNGLLADVWSSFGIVSVFIMPIIMVACLRFLDFCTSKCSKRMTIGIVLLYAVYFCNTQWSTVLLTHGFVLVSILLMFISGSEKNE